ncbi:MFS transporter [Acaryochloris sp. CCMEE 5410]|uniref:MFS transporter n=1 Tax=Acaryochloris sp. CCMEE 5410 TaxID=310037 RepID=UPI0007C74667|nr:MFS transporter [Acaryochloris sp. CCMEE 5410]KAI9131981.1 MFS transporter [Acaryochloris sp. CCMEE 5410]
MASGGILAIASSPLLIAQLSPETTAETAAEAAFVFSGPQFIVTIISGVLLAFGFQMLLTNLSVATGVSYLSFQAGSSSNSSDEGGLSLRTITLGMGLWTLVSVTIALFAACLLAIKLSLLQENILLGAIIGLVIWATYFSLLVWFSSTTVGSLIGSVVKTATSGFQSILGTATSAIAAKGASDTVVATAEAAAAAVRRELMADVDPETLRENLQDYLATLRSPSFDLQGIEQEFEQIITTSDLSQMADREALKAIDRQTFAELVQSRTDLSRREAKQVTDRLYQTWQRLLVNQPQGDPMRELVTYLQSAQPQQLIATEIGPRLDKLIAQLKQDDQQQDPASTAGAFGMLSSVVMGRSDLSEMDVDRITEQLQTAKNHVTDQANKLAAAVDPNQSQTVRSVVQRDVENYLLNTYVWQKQPERLEHEFREVLYDPTADPAVLREHLRQLHRPQFKQYLKSRGILTQTKIQALASQLDAVRHAVIQELSTQIKEQVRVDLFRRIQTYLELTPKTEMLSNMGDRAFTALLEDEQFDPNERYAAIAQIHRDLLLQPLVTRSDLTTAEIELLVNRLEQIHRRVVAETHADLQSSKSSLEKQSQSLQDYLRNTNKAALNPEGIKRDLKKLLDEPKVGVRRLRRRMAQFDRDTFVQLLNQRQDLSEGEVNAVIDDLEAQWYGLVNAPDDLTTKAQDKFNQATSAVENYLRNTNRAELNPDGIKRDLQTLLNDPSAGLSALRDRLSRMDRETLVQLLSQRDDLSEQEVNRIIDDMLQSIQEVLRTPRRFAKRTQVQVQSFQTALADYLRGTDKAELNPDDIQRDLTLLLNDPRLGAERLSDRLAQVDRTTLVALLAQRKDMSEQEARETIDQVLAVRDQIASQIQQVQLQIQSVIDQILAKIRYYLNSLNRPELEYEGIKRDVRQLFDDPQAGLQALQDRLSQFDRQTLVAVLSSHDQISEADVHQIIDQVEAARDSVLRRAQRLEQQLNNRISDLQVQTQKQYEATCKAAALASWWLFATALISAGAAAGAGILAV